MPTYEYACADCGDLAALRQMSRRHEPVECPGMRCGGGCNCC